MKLNIIRRILFGKDFECKTLWEKITEVFLRLVLAFMIFCIVRLYLIQNYEASFLYKLVTAILEFCAIFVIPILIYIIVVYIREEKDRPLTYTRTTTTYSDGSKEVHTSSDSQWLFIALMVVLYGFVSMVIYNSIIAPMLWLKQADISIYSKNDQHFFCDEEACHISLFTAEPKSSKNILNGKNASQTNASQPKKHKKKHQNN
jgi:hypothetical protein